MQQRVCHERGGDVTSPFDRGKVQILVALEKTSPTRSYIRAGYPAPLFATTGTNVLVSCPSEVDNSHQNPDVLRR
jgi:hypothetical protein